MTLIEVLVSALVVVTVGTFVAMALISSAYVASDQRRRSQAADVGQQDQERLKGLSSLQLNGLDQAQQRTVAENGTTFTVTSSAQFLNSTGGSSCGSSGVGAAAYYEVISSVNWASNKRPSVVVHSMITPPAGGTLLTQVNDQTGAPVSGVSVAASGPDSASGATDVHGCVIFADLNSGDYTLTLNDPGYVDPDGNPTPVSISATVTSSGTATPSSGNPLILGLAGTISSTFTAGGGALTGQQADALSWYGSGASNSMSDYRTFAYGAVGVQGTPIPASGAIKLFPFAFAGPSYTGNYQAWAGPCRQMQPPVATDTFTVTPGSNQGIAVAEPALNVVVTFAGPRVKPDHIKISFASSSGPACTDTWVPQVVSDAATNPNGSLASPGQPFASSATSGPTESASTYTGGLTVCADYSNHKASVATTNANFSAATPVTVAIANSNPTRGTC